MRKLKGLGLALVAVFAMSAMTAVAAQAKEEGHVVTSKNTATHEVASITGTDVGETKPLVFTANGQNIACAVNEFHGESEATGTTKNLTVKTAFGGPTNAAQKCTAAGSPATVFNNGCHVRFNTFETAEPLLGTTWKATTDVLCPAGVAGIEVKVYAGGSHGFQVCKITVPPQSGLQGVTAHNNVNTPSKAHDITVTAAVKNIKETQSGLCGAKETTTAEMNGEVTVTAKNAGGEPIDIYIAHTK